MTDRPSIESLRAALAHLDNQSCHGALSDEAYALLSAGISELESLRARPITGIGDGDIRAALAERDALRASEADLQRDHDALTSLHAGTESTLHALRAENKMLRANPRMLVHPDGRAERLESDQEAALRAENARLVAERDGLKEKCADLDAGWKTASELLEIQKTHLTAAESRADALAARVEVLCEALRNLRYNFGGANLMAAEHAADAVLNSTPAADLSAHDAKVREPLEDVLRTLASWLGNGGYNAPSPIDPAQFEAKIRDGVECELKMAKVLALSGARTRAFNFWNNGRHSGYLDLYAAIEDKPNHPVEEGLISAHDERVRREEREAAAKKCAEAYWAMVAPKDHAAMHPTIEFWRDALGLEPLSPAEHEALAAIEPRHPEIVMVDDLAMLVRLLVHSIRKHSPDNETARKAMDYLRRHELQGSPLRTTILSPAPDAAKPNNQQEQP